MSDEHLRPLNPGENPDDERLSSVASSIPAELRPLDDLLARDGRLWRADAPSDRRLAQLARQLATYVETPASAPDEDDAPSEPTIIPLDASRRLLVAPRLLDGASRWRLPGAVAAAVVIVGLLATVLYTVAGSRTSGPATVGLGGDCTTAHAAPAQVDWPQFGFGASGGRCNPYESRLTPASVGGLKLAWSAPGQFIDSSPAVVGGRVYLASIYPESTLYAFDARTGQKIWATPDGQPVETSSTSPAVADGKVLLGVGNSLEAFAADSGRLAWKFSAGGIITTSPAIADGVAYVAFQDSYVYALSLKTGERLWKMHLDGVPVAGPVAVAEHTVYVSANMLYALDRATGAIRWRVGSGPLNAPVVAGNIVYASESDFRIHAFAADTGHPLWTSEPLRNVVTSPVSLVRGKLYTGDANGAVWMLDGASGSRQWTMRLPDSSIVFSSPAIADGVVYVTGSCDCGTSAAHFIFALQASNGKLLWQYAPGYPVYTSPVVANGYLYVATYKGLDAFAVPG